MLIHDNFKVKAGWMKRNDVVVSWADLIAPLEKGWHEASDRAGSFADGPCEPAGAFGESLDAVESIEKTASRGVKTWIATGALPQMPPAANRYAEVWFICALGFVRGISSKDAPTTPQIRPGVQLHVLLDWLLFDLRAATTQVSLDDMRMDLLGDGV
jgi:hypothetical protein